MEVRAPIKQIVLFVALVLLTSLAIEGWGNKSNLTLAVNAGLKSIAYAHFLGDGDALVLDTANSQGISPVITPSSYPGVSNTFCLDFEAGIPAPISVSATGGDQGTEAPRIIPANLPSGGQAELFCPGSDFVFIGSPGSAYVIFYQ